MKKKWIRRREGVYVYAEMVRKGKRTSSLGYVDRGRVGWWYSIINGDAKQHISLKNAKERVEKETR